MKIISRDSNPAFNKKLKELLAFTNDWDRKINRYELEVAIQEFMDAIWELYLNYFQYHPEEAKICAIDFQELLKAHIDTHQSQLRQENVFFITSCR